MSHPSQSRRSLVQLRLLKLLHIVLMTLPFAIAWGGAYVRLSHMSMAGVAGAAVTLVFLVLYVLFTRIYGAFFISQSRISELVASQILSALLADLFCYLLLSLLLRRFPGVWPKVLVLPVQKHRPQL